MWIQIETAFDTFVRGLWTLRALFLLPGSYSLKFLKYLRMEGLNVQDETSNVNEGFKNEIKNSYSIRIMLLRTTVLKSADVETLFSSRYFENSSHAHTRRHPHTFTNTCAHPPTLCTPAHTHAHPCIPAHTHSSSRTHSSSSRWVWTDQSYVTRSTVIFFKKNLKHERECAGCF